MHTRAPPVKLASQKDNKGNKGRKETSVPYERYCILRLERVSFSYGFCHCFCLVCSWGISYLPQEVVMSLISPSAHLLKTLSCRFRIVCLDSHVGISGFLQEVELE